MEGLQIAVPFCDYHMRYARGWESPEDRRVNLSTLFVGKVDIRMDILEGRLGIIGIPNGDRVEIRQELDLLKNRSGYGRRKSGIIASKRPLLTSTEWVWVQIRERVGRMERQSMDRGDQWGLLERLGWFFCDDRRVKALKSRENNRNRWNYYRFVRNWMGGGISAS